MLSRSFRISVSALIAAPTFRRCLGSEGIIAYGCVPDAGLHIKIESSEQCKSRHCPGKEKRRVVERPAKSYN